MSHAIRPGERLSHAIERVARAELRKGRKGLKAPVAPGTAATSAHTLRLATKRVRAITRLVQPAVGRKARRANHAIGACADVMAPVRDADAAVRTFEKVRAALPPRARSSTDAVRVALAERLRHEAKKLEAAEGKRILRKLRRALHQQQDAVARWTPGGDRWSAVGPGLQAGYRRARKTMHHAYQQPNGDTFHAWRRAVKAHRYQIRLLSPCAPAELDARAAELAQLAECLGDEHDLTMLRRTLRANRFWFADESDIYYELIRRIDQQRREKRQQALPLGDRLFAERPGALARRMRRHFRDFRREPGPQVGAANAA